MAQLELIFHPANEAQNVVWGSDRRFLAIKEDGQHFQNFYVGYEGIFYMPNSEIKCPFNTVYFDILCGQSLSGLSQVFQCVKEVPVNMHRELTNIYIYTYPCYDFINFPLKNHHYIYIPSNENYQFSLFISFGK